MTEEEAYDKLQELLAIASELFESGFYTVDEIVAEVNGFLR